MARKQFSFRFYFDSTSHFRKIFDFAFERADADALLQDRFVCCSDVVVSIYYIRICTEGNDAKVPPTFQIILDKP